MNALALQGADPLVVERHVVILPLQQALECLRFQPRLAAPAKLALAGHGDAELFAEVGRGLDVHEALACADAAVVRARLWLAGEPPEPAPPELRAALEEGLVELGWSFEPRPDGSFRVSAVFGSSPTHVQVEALPGDQLRVWQDSLLPLREADPDVLGRFALECNARLRHARLSIVPADPGTVRAVWDAVMNARTNAAEALADAAAAVVFAKAETLGGLRALRHASVRRVFEQLRAPRS